MKKKMKKKIKYANPWAVDAFQRSGAGPHEDKKRKKLEKQARKEMREQE